MRMMLHPPRAARGTAPAARTPVAQAKLAVGAPGDRWEREADRVADAVMRGSAPDAGARVQADGEGAVRRMPADGGGAPRVSPAADAHVRAATRSGAPLAPSLRGMFEGRLGADLGGVRVHTGGAAEAAARALGARAFTVGRDIVFGAGEYAPGTARGQRLVAHELAHTLQQQALGPDAAGRVLQRQPTTGSGSAPADITAQDIFPFPQGARVVLGRIMPNWIYGVVSGTDPATTDPLDAVNGKEARVTSATPDLFEAVVGTPVELPARGNQAARTLRDATVRLERSGGTFTFTLSAQEGTPASTVVLSRNAGLTARRDGASIVLSSGAAPNFVPELRLTPGTNQVDLAAFTAPLLARMGNLPPGAGALVPNEVEFLRIRRLPDAATRADVQRATEAIAAGVRPRRQAISLGAGFSEAGGRFAPLFTAGWQIHFPIPHAVVGQFLQVPLELRVQYAPSEGVLGTATSGANLRIPTSVPVNVTLIGGVGGGQIQVPGTTPGTVDTQGALGPVVGGGAGVELGTFRVNLRYEHLFNLLPSTNDVNQLSIGLGRAF